MNEHVNAITALAQGMHDLIEAETCGDKTSVKAGNLWADILVTMVYAAQNNRHWSPAMCLSHSIEAHDLDVNEILVAGTTELQS